MTINIGVLLSGTGTNLQAIIDAIAAKRLDARVAVVISNVASAGGLDRARAANVPTQVIDHRAYTSRKHFDAEVVHALERHGAEWVVLAGFMRVLTPTLLDAFPMRVINIHPALLPSFPGLNAQSQAFQYGVRVAGCTVHFVDNGTDTGPILAQSVVPVLPGDDDEALRKRILGQEHALLTDVLQWIAEGRVTVKPNPMGGRPRVAINGVEPFRGVAR
jgi:phosphoribosylglycinamide formyltransferase-1